MSASKSTKALFRRRWTTTSSGSGGSSSTSVAVALPGAREPWVDACAAATASGPDSRTSPVASAAARPARLSRTLPTPRRSGPDDGELRLSTPQNPQFLAARVVSICQGAKIAGAQRADGDGLAGAQRPKRRLRAW